MHADVGSSGFDSMMLIDAELIRAAVKWIKREEGIMIRFVRVC